MKKNINIKEIQNYNSLDIDSDIMLSMNTYGNELIMYLP